ncbi:hypothetical protein FOZ63_021226, partial [Perkinsus olseni]
SSTLPFSAPQSPFDTRSTVLSMLSSPRPTPRSPPSTRCFISCLKMVIMTCQYGPPFLRTAALLRPRMQLCDTTLLVCSPRMPSRRGGIRDTLSTVICDLWPSDASLRKRLTLMMTMVVKRLQSNHSSNPQRGPQYRW